MFGNSVEPLPIASARWVDHFRNNRSHFDHVDWRATIITKTEARAIRKSIAEFQLGESSEGKHLIHCAIDHSIKIDDPEYAVAIGYFVAEENSHARALGRLMDGAGIMRRQRTGLDMVFRLLRKGMKLEVSISVLLTAELIAQVYYQALRDATQSYALKQICEQILRDEENHVLFQSQRLAILQRSRTRSGLQLSMWARRILLAGTLPLVWFNHRKALEAGGFGPIRFWRECWRAYFVSERIADPAAYQWTDPITDAPLV